MGHAALPLCKTLRPPSLLTPFRRGSLPARLGAAAACRYHNTAAPYADRWLLLPLCGIEARGRLCKDVRIQEICVSLVGQELREAAHEHAEARLARRTAIPTSQAVGARPTLKHSSRLLAVGLERESAQVSQFQFSQFRAFPFAVSRPSLSGFSHFRRNYAVLAAEMEIEGWRVRLPSPRRSAKISGISKMARLLCAETFLRNSASV